MARPFQSKFIPYVNQIKAWRRAGKTWEEVAKALTDLGVKADAGNVCRVMGRIKRRPYPLGAEPEPEHVDAAPAQPAAEPEIHSRKEQPAKHSLTRQKPSKLTIETIRHE